jgi:chemosensory pili system protein ChpA (sensor histidine kinase/response regulator)
MSALREAMSHAVLGWVKPELDETLRQARGEVEAFVEDPNDSSRMRFCAGYLHQVQGTLRMVELYAPAMVAEELELLAQALQQGSISDRDEACATLMRGTVLLPDYLERLQNGHRDIPIVLLPLLNDIRGARGAAGLSESVLFAPDLNQPLPEELPEASPLPWTQRQDKVVTAQGRFEAELDRWPEQGQPADPQALAEVADELLQNARHDSTRRMLWVLASSAQALRDGALAAGPALRTAFAGIARALRQAQEDEAQGDGSQGVASQEPTRQLLFLVAQARVAHPALDELRKTFDLDTHAPTEAELDHARGSLAGRNRDLLNTVGSVVKEELLRVKDALDLHLRTGGDASSLQPQAEELTRVADTLGMLGLGVARDVVKQQRDSLAAIARGEQPASEDALLDIAGALLYVDASLDDQVASLGTSSGDAEDAAAVEAQRTVEVLAHEAIANFAAAREHFVAFIETNWDHARLVEVPRLLEEVAGALGMLDLPQPASYLEGVRRYIAIELIGRRRVPSGRQLDTLADAMASLEYYLEALRDRRPNREEILEIARTSLENLNYWPLPKAEAEVAADGQPAQAGVSAPAQPVPAETHVAPAPAVAQDKGEAAVPPAGPAWDAVETRLVTRFGSSDDDASVFGATADVGRPEAEQLEAPALDIAPVAIERFEFDTPAPAPGAAAFSFDPVAAEYVVDAQALSAPSAVLPLELEGASLSDAPTSVAPLELEDDGSLEVAGLDRADLEQSGLEPILSLVDEDQAGPAQDAEADATTPASADARVGDGPGTPALEPIEFVDMAEPTPPPGLQLRGSETGQWLDMTVKLQVEQRPVTVFESQSSTLELDGEASNLIAEMSAAAADLPSGAFGLQAPAVDAGQPPAAVAPAPALPAAPLVGGFDESQDIDADIREVFLEEFEEERGNLARLLPHWRLAPQDMERLRPVRRVFHTLKGSGRLVGARALGEFAWKIESTLNRVLDGTRPPSEAVLALVGQACDVLPQLDGALRGTGAISADLAAMEAVAERVAAGEEVFYQAPDAADDQPGTAAIEVAEVLEQQPAAAQEEGTPASVDSVLREILEAEVATHLETVDAWTAAAAAQPQPVSDALMRAMHTMNGAFAMTDVPEITSVTDPAETLIKRMVAGGQQADADTVAAIADTAEAIRGCIRALQGEFPRIPSYAALSARLQALAERLPEARWPQESLYEQEPEEPAADAGADLTGVQDLSAFLYPDHLERTAPVAPEADLPHQAVSDDVAAASDAQPGHAAQTGVGEAQDPLASGVDGLADAEAALQAMLASYQAEESAPAQADASGAEAAEEQGEDAAGQVEGESIGLAAADETLDQVAAGEEAVVEADVPDAQAQDDTNLADLADVKTVDIAAAADPGTEPRLEAVPVEESSPHADAEVAPPDLAEPEPVAASFIPEPSPAAAAPASALEAEMLDFSELDRELVDIFVEEGVDLLDHIDGLIQELRTEPTARESVIGLQRDLHTLKGGARMAGIAAIGDLGHVIESLLEAAAEQRTELQRGDIQLLERGFDSLHRLLQQTRAHRVSVIPHALIEEFEARIRGQAYVPSAEESHEQPQVQVAAQGPSATDQAVEDQAGNAQAGDLADLASAQVQAVAQPVPTPAPAPGPAIPAVASFVGDAPSVVLPPLSAPVVDEVEQAATEDAVARAPQEQVRVRADLLDNLVNHAGEVAIYRARLEQQLGAFRSAMAELERTNARLRDQLRRLDLETEAQIVARYQREQDSADTTFDPLELDRFSTLQQLSRGLGESAADLTGLQGVLDDLARQYDVLLQQQSRVSSELQDGLMSARMVPFDSVVPRLRRVVRQAAHETRKQVQLKLDGTHGELDRNVIDRMVAPLEHMLRNSVAHGLELPEDRRASGKLEEGSITVALRHEGSEIVLRVSDDGRGLDREAIRKRAEKRGLLKPDAVISDAELDSVIFEPGFSTSEQVSQLAGRGVGMDVVRNEIRQLGGTVEIESVAGQGVTFTLRLPQTLAVTQAVFVEIGDTTYAVPVASVSGIGRISRERFEAGSGVYRYAGEEYTLYDLGRMVGQGPAKAEGQAQVPLLLVRAGDLRAAVAIDQVVGNREIVVKPVGLQIASVPGIYGATITGDGRVVVILDVAPLVRRHLAQPDRPQAEVSPQAQRQVPLVMVVDDSLTMRKVTGRVLERHNFEVVTARDGVEALERLEERVPDLMLLDIEMPRMDGYELATAMRADDRFRGVPIVMITSRTGEKHRQRAFEIGVQRYLGKPYQELDLMRNVYDMLGIARVRE